MGSANKVNINHTAVNYTAATPDIEGHVAGIDTALATGTLTTVNIYIDGVLSTGDGAQPIELRVPADGFVLEEVVGFLKVAAGTQLSIQLAEMTEADVFVEDVLTAVLSFGTATTASTAAFSGGTTPDKGHWYRVDIDVITGTPPEGLTVQLKLRQKPGLTL